MRCGGDLAIAAVGIGIEQGFCLATSAQIRRNCFRLSLLMTIVVISFQKPYANLESGTNLVMYDVY
jgi:hypothetical protein